MMGSSGAGSLLVVPVLGDPRLVKGNRNDPCRDCWYRVVGTDAGQCCAGQERRNPFHRRLHPHARNSAKHSIVLANDLDALLADPAIDAVVFATPHSQHGPQVECAAAAGKPVFMEKPFTLDVASAERALNAAARAGIVLAVAYPRRFHPAVAELKARIADGRLGVLSHCQSEQTAPAGLSMRADYWRSDPVEAPAGAMTATGVHSVDLLIHLFGRIDEVYCLSHRRVMARLEDTTAVLFGLANGMTATLYCSLVTAVSARFAVFGTKGC